MVDLPVAFQFEVKLDGAADADAAFREVSGLEVEVQVEEIAEGGENRFVHKLPKPAKHPNLVLKRGIAASGSDLVKWCKEVIENDFMEPIKPRNLVVNLLDAEHSPLVTWSLSNVWPLKWKVADLDAMKNEVALETIELAYNTVKRSA